tara:strand:- start:469 stop:624 length:156 start_codon:yes stop_codon:yes gene_type:complete
LRIKSHLSQKGPIQVLEIDQKRANNKNLGVEFTLEPCEVLAEQLNGSEVLR